VVKATVKKKILGMWANLMVERFMDYC